MRARSTITPRIHQLIFCRKQALRSPNRFRQREFSWVILPANNPVFDAIKGTRTDEQAIFS
jgi:hypothetical protein